MNRLRVAWKTGALAMCTAATYVFLVGSSVILGLVRGARWNAPVTARWRTWIFHRWARVVRSILRMSSTVHGRPPRSPFYLVANHLGYIDIVTIAAETPCVFVAKGEVAGWPVMGTLCRAADTLFIDRNNKRDIPRVVREIDRVLAGGRGVVVFPEGSSTEGAEVLPFRPSLLEAAARAGIPVSYAALSYRTPEGSAPARLAVCWWGDMTFGGHLPELLGLPGIEASVVFGEEPIRERNRKRLAERLHCAVEQRFQPVV